MHVIQHGLQGFIVGELDSTKIDGAFCTKRRKSVEKMIHQKKNRGHRTSKVVKSRKSCSNGHLPYHCSFYYLARALLHDAACEFACAVTMRRNNDANVLEPENWKT